MTDDPCAGITGTLTSEKALVDRRTGSLRDVTTILSWDIHVPPTCDLSILASISGSPIADPQGEASGAKDFLVLQTTNFQLRANGQVLDSVLVTVVGDPGNVSISPGPTITQADLDQFNAMYMQPYAREQAVGAFTFFLTTRDAGIMWDVFDATHAMVRMFDLTHDTRYATHLRDVAGILLPLRDDKFLTPPAIDLLRGQTAPLPAWGGVGGIWSAGYYQVGEASFAYLYSIAANARIVLEDPAFRAAHGQEVLDQITEVFDTEALFAAQIATRDTVTGPEARLVTPNLAYAPSHAECDAYLAMEELRHPDQAGSDRFRSQLRGCYHLGDGQGATLPYNYQFLYMAAITELWRALDTPFAREHLADPRASALRAALPVRISRMLNYFIRRVHTDSLGAYLWNYNDEVGPGINTHVEDASHGSIDMVGLDVVRTNMGRLNTVAAAAGEPMYPLTVTELEGFAKSVTLGLLYPPALNMAENLIGHVADPIDKRNNTCDGWVNLAESDPVIYDRCYAITFRVVGSSQPYLTRGSYASLLKNKRWLPVPPPPPPPPPPPAPKTCKATQTCCDEGPDGGCLLCISRGQSCK